MSRLDAILTIDSSVVKIVNNVAYNASGNVVKYDADAATTVEQLLILRRMRNAKLAETDWWASSEQMNYSVNGGRTAAYNANLTTSSGAFEVNSDSGQVYDSNVNVVSIHGDLA